MKPAEEDKPKVVKKLDTVRKTRYVAWGWVKSLLQFFYVPKGVSDVQMVYDATASGLNDAVWAPRFGLPTIDTHTWMLKPKTFMSDRDLGEMF